MNNLNSSHPSSQPKLSRLQRELRPGLLATTASLAGRGYSRQLLDHYVSSGWLESPARGVFRRPGPPLKWQHVVASLQNLLQLPVHVGGLSALEIQGHGHFVRLSGVMTVHLYTLARLPSWLTQLPLKDTFVVHRERLFNESATAPGASVTHVARDVTAQKQVERELAEQRSRELEKLAELERFHRVTIDRELKMIELKKEITELNKGGRR